MVRKSTGDIEVIEAVDRHIQEHIGEIDLVLDEKDSPYVHIDVHVVKPTPKRNFFTLVTSGMSELPMPAPETCPEGRFAELMICLPPKWPFGMKEFKQEENWWPIRFLKGMARFPHEHATWLYEGHTMAYEESKPFAPNTSMNCGFVFRPTTIDEKAATIRITDDKHARLLAAYPIYEEERELAAEGHSMDLAVLFGQNGITEILDPKRKNLAL